MKEKEDKYYEKVDSSLRFLLGVKLNNFIHPRSKLEEEKILRMADEWIKEHPGEHINLY